MAPVTRLLAGGGNGIQIVLSETLRFVTMCGFAGWHVLIAEY